ncbi:pirin family protein [Thermoflexibacter ruber]|nr:hypothetical protein [Thermoflexibacter ruber]
MQQTKGLIYLAEKRSGLQTTTLKSLQTLPASNTEINRSADLHGIHRFSDNLLLGGQSYFPAVKQAACLVLLPLTGAMEVYHQGKSELIGIGEIAFLKIENEGKIQIENPYLDEAINFLEIWISIPPRYSWQSFLNIFDIEKQANQLIALPNSTLPFQLWIGKFDGRKEEILSLKKEQKLFAFVIHGAFEFQNRLLEGRDAVCLWDCEGVEFEALANESILLLIAC